MKTTTLLASLLVFSLFAACAKTPTRPNADAKTGVAESETYLDASFVEATGDNKVLLRCTGQGMDVAAATLHARKSCLLWVAKKRLTQTPEEKRRLAAKTPELLKQVEKLVAKAGPGGRTRRSGIVNKMRQADGVRVELMTQVDESSLRKLLTEWKVLDNLALPGGRKLRLVLLPSGPGDKHAIKFARAVLFEKLEHLPVEWLDLPAPHADNLKAAKNANADLLIELTSEEREEGESVAFTVTLKVSDLAKGTIGATTSAQGIARYAKQPGARNSALLEPINDAAAKLVPQMRALIRQFAKP
ncbi:MAG: hypothetical protein JRF33_07835 [Deltaproteobacteria bacterium]|nr:hypothetical protein [Deltaproteobacteria bacterium]